MHAGLYLTVKKFAKLLVDIFLDPPGSMRIATYMAAGLWVLCPTTETYSKPTRKTI